jgi:DNA (cytosine-5)-methyltransferase 1
MKEKIEKYNLLDLFSGIAGFSLALKPVCTTIAYSEINDNAIKVINNQIGKGYLDSAPNLGDITKITQKTFKYNKIKNIDIISGGFPCQDISLMNYNGAGLQGSRSKLFFEIIRLLTFTHPSIIVLENSPNIVNKGIESVIEALQNHGYDTAYDFFSASQVGAPHRRKRFYLIAFKKNKKSFAILNTFSKSLKNVHDVVNRSWEGSFKKLDVQDQERIVIRTKVGSKSLKNRTFLLGNSIVPKCARYAIQFLSEHVIANKQNRGFLGLSTYREATPYPIKMVIPSQKFIENDEITRSDEFVKNQLSTPLATNFQISCVGSIRAMNILQNEIMYDVRTFMNIKDKNVENWEVNPIFIEWLMGYKTNWTKIE